MYDFFKSVIDNDRAPVVICDTEHRIIYMNPAAVKNYGKRGGAALVGKSLLSCHNPESCAMIKRVVAWFLEDAGNNMLYTSKNESKGRDVYMVALRDADKRLIGYYEKHEYRNCETAKLYDFSESLI